MDFEAEFIRENKASKYPSLFCEKYQKPSKRCDLIPSDQIPSPNKSNYLQDFHPLDHHDFNNFHAHNGSSSSPKFSSQTAPFDPFENSLGFSGQVVVLTNNFQTSGDCCLNNLPLANPSTSVDMINNNTNGSEWSCLPLNGQDHIIEKPMMSLVVPNQDQAISCITPENGYYKKVVAMNKISTSRACLTKKKSYKGQQIKTTIKGQWKIEEDSLLIQLVDQYGLRKWSHIAQMLPGRIGKQCRERWHNHLRPDIKKDAWSEEEDKVLIEAHIEIGNKWAEIAKRLAGRTENSIKNHWNATKRRQYSKRKPRSTKSPRPSLLQDYIKSLKLDSSTKTTRQYTRKATILSKTVQMNAHNFNNRTADLPIDVDPPLNCTIDEDYYDHDVFGDDSDFCFGKNMIFQEGSIDSLFDDIVPRATICADDDIDHGKEVLMVDLSAEDSNNIGAVEFGESYDEKVVMKKELDLVEMISQVNKVIG